MGSFLGIENRQVEKPTWESLMEGMRRAFTFDAGPAPSRGTVAEMARGDEDPKDRDKRLREEFARNRSEANRSGEDPRNIRTQRSHVPRDEPRPPVGTGVDLTPLPSHTPRSERGEPGTYEGQYVVRMPDGRAVVTEDPGSVMASGGGTVDPPGRKADVASGQAGTIFADNQKGPFPNPMGDPDFSQVNLPTDEDRSPGWAARAAIAELNRTGELSMDPRDIMDRRRFEESETARDMARERAEVEHSAALRAAMMPPVDPYALAEIEAQGKYGGEAIEREGEQERIAYALAYYEDISQKILAIEEQLSQLDPESQQAAALAQTRDRLIQERREMPNIALGYQLRDPKLDPFAALAAGIAGMGAPSTEGGK